MAVLRVLGAGGAGLRGHGDHELVRHAANGVLAGDRRPLSVPRSSGTAFLPDELDRRPVFPPRFTTVLLFGPAWREIPALRAQYRSWPVAGCRRQPGLVVPRGDGELPAPTLLLARGPPGGKPHG